MPRIPKELDDWDGGDWSHLTDEADPNEDGWDAPVIWVVSQDELFEAEVQ